MSVVIKTTEMQYRDANGVYHGINAVAEKKIADQEAALDQIIAGAQGAVNQLETQKNTIAQTVASMAQLGTDTTLSTPGMAADAGACGDLKSALSDLEDISLAKQEMTASATASGWRLNESNGLCSESSGYKLVKYQVIEGTLVKVISDDRFQFQNSASVPSTAPNNRVGGVTYGVGTYFFTVPTGATYLIISTPTESTAHVYYCEPTQELKSDISNSPFVGKSFVISAGTTHSSVKDKLPVNIKAGEKYNVYYSTGLLYAFYSDGTDEQVSEKGTATKNITSFGIYKTNSGETPLEVIVRVASNPMGADIVDSVQKLDDLENLCELVSKGYYTRQTETGYAIANNKSAGTYVDIDNPSSSSNMASIVVKNVEKGMSFKVFGSGSYNYVLWAWLDEDQKMISHENAWESSGSTGTIITAPNNAKYLVCSSTYDYSYGFNVQYLGATEYLSVQVDEIKHTVDPSRQEANLVKNGTFKFAFFSDIHNGNVNAQHIVDFATKKNLDCIINAGDTVQNYLNDPNNNFDWYAMLLGESSVDLLSAVGNHDVWDGAYFTKAADIDIYNAIVAPIISNFEDIVQPTGASVSGLCYYYKDYSSVRVIVLNAMAGDSSVNFWTEEQGTWLSNVLSDAKTNSKHVIICNHPPFPKNIALRDEKSNWNSYYDYRSSATYDDIAFDTNALNIIKSFVDSGGILVCLLTGHVHADSILTAIGFDGQFMLNIASAKYPYHSDGITYDNKTSPYFDCFDYCTVDTTNGILKLKRIGWNMDASLKVRDTLSYNYINHKLLHD